ncbi:MobP3 family relaxase [Eisenbergiella tayi]|uniref:MobP3 family relaxase n=1 Tax=Eisenbergiella tayi TaxID=1432052 RepID=UPI00084837C2|nr:MobP3 family relaxase [Eisenbergiella tayi]ODR28306.1 hypothetical protein BEI60_31240 [Eisenbergiella tayi]
MAKIIFTSHYMRDAPPSHVENYIRYISTREGVEKIDENRYQLPVTERQKKLIQQMLRDIPAARELLEYEDYYLQPTMGSASEFITCTLEQNMDLLGKRKNYVDYIANRPRVERIGEHGLFTDAGQPVVLAKVQEEVIKHKGPVWTHVISLRREDAARLGYDSGEQWMALLRSKRAMFCREMKIDSPNLRWFAAYHNEGHHPHVHLMVYSAKDNDGYLTEKSIEAMRSELAHDIFRQDFAHIYEEQKQAHKELKTGATDVIRELIDALQSGTLASPEIERMMVRLSERLQNTGGKKVYGYLKRDVKYLIDNIVDELAKDSRIDALYQAWGKYQNEILLTYRNEVSPLPPLSQQPKLKSIKNMVIAEALKLGSHHFSFEDDFTEPAVPDDAMPEQGQEAVAETVPEKYESEESASVRGRSSGQKWWSRDYKLARQYLYGSGEMSQDFSRAYSLFLQEAEAGNALAMHDLGRRSADGLGCETDGEKAQEWYGKALEAFLEEEKGAQERQRPYIQYRIGKMYMAGLGTGQDYEAAAKWFSKAVSANHNICNANKFALYSLAGMYYRGQGVEQDYEHAFRLYQRSAEQENPYAAYELAKMYRDGIGTGKNQEAAEEHYENSFHGFTSLESRSHDDKLQYRLGQMLHTGTGTKKDDTAAAEYWKSAARLGNVNAQYALGRLLLERGDNPEQAAAWITKAAESGSAAAQYALGKLYRDGDCVPRNIAKAMELFTLAAEQKNEYAAYQLGRLYLAGKNIPEDVEAAVRWLAFSADLNNQYAQYTLGKLYLEGGEVLQDVSKAMELFRQSADQKYDYAQYQLGKLFLAGEHIPKDVDAAVYWLDESAEQGNQYAQYILGKLYLCGKDVSHDKEKAVMYLKASAAQGNIYAQFFLDHLDSFGNPSAFLTATRLLHQLERLFREDYRKTIGGSSYIDRKRRRKLAEKKQALGHKQDDREPVQQLY